MILTSLVLLVHQVTAGVYNYVNHGSDWPDLFEYCYGKTR